MLVVWKVEAERTALLLFARSALVGSREDFELFEVVVDAEFVEERLCCMLLLCFSASSKRVSGGGGELDRKT